jgi:tRNA-uridine 2-sulfurtransferase
MPKHMTNTSIIKRDISTNHHTPPERIFVGMSGGVDSSVTAHMLVKQGYDVTGVFIRGWYPEHIHCNWKQDQRDAMRICAQLNIPFLTLDVEKEYKTEVIDYLISEYKAGRTPNPDSMCNKHIKFGHFYQYARKQGADAIATGHYARCIEGELHTAVDMDKDQSYFLWGIDKDVLPRVMFPLGEMKKQAVRAYAKKHGLKTASKPDSQGICFIGVVDLVDFLKAFIDIKPGDILNEAGEKIGTHRGALVYTRGQRHGLSVSDSREPHFVTERDLDNNTVTVSTVQPEISEYTQFLQLTDINLLVDSAILDSKMSIDIMLRYHGERIPILQLHKNEHGYIAEVPTGTLQPAAGQSAVLYKDSLCLVGGVIQ